MSHTFGTDRPSDQAIDLMDADTGQGASVPGSSEIPERRAFTVTIKTPAGHEHRFRVSGAQQVETVTQRAVDYFVAHGELASGRYMLALLRGGRAEDLTASARLEDYGVHEDDLLVLIVGEPQVDG